MALLPFAKCAEDDICVDSVGVWAEYVWLVFGKSRVVGECYFSSLDSLDGPSNVTEALKTTRRLQHEQKRICCSWFKY